ncbi:ABC transporter ATP-binding protein [Lachnospiraceae bacterium LCP25S3_G4]
MKPIRAKEINGIIKTKGVTFKDILIYPDLEVPEGKITFLQGPSGCGKSTLLKLFNQTLSQSKGTILYMGLDVNDMDTIALRKEVLLISQFVYLFSGSIRYNFEEFYKYRGKETPSTEKMEMALSICQANFDLDVSCDNMSGGERQRVYIAIAISFCPKILMMDEPTSALDAHTAHVLMKNIKSYCSEHEITVLVISHDANLVAEFADDIIALEGCRNYE